MASCLCVAGDLPQPKGMSSSLLLAREVCQSQALGPDQLGIGTSLCFPFGEHGPSPLLDVGARSRLAEQRVSKGRVKGCEARDQAAAHDVKGQR